MNTQLAKTRRTRCIVAGFLLLLLAGIVTWNNTLSNSFLYDDETFIVNNEGIRTLTPLGKFFSPVASSSNPQMNRDVWRPLTTFSFALNYAASGLDPRPYHGVNLAVHLANGCLVFLLFLLLLGKTRNNGISAGGTLVVSFAAALIFLVHPVQSESVAWVSQRSNVLFLLFYLSSLITRELSARSSSRVLYAVSISTFALSLLSKEMAISLPLVVFAVSWVLERRTVKQSVATALPYAAVAALFAVARTLALGQTAQTTYWAGGLYPQVLTMVKGFAWYVKLAFLPHPLSIEYLFPVKRALDMEVVLCGMLCIAILYAGFKTRKREPLISFGIFLFFIALLPVSNIIPIRTVINERFLYLSLAGSGLIVGRLVHALLERATRPVFMVHRILSGGALAGIAVALSAGMTLTVQRNATWKNHWTMVSANIKTCPQSAMLHFGLGKGYAMRGDYGRAAKEFELSLRIDPGADEMLNGMGWQGERQADILRYRESIQKRVDCFDGFSNLGIAYLRMGEYARAEILLRTACAMRPADREVRSNLAVAAAYSGDIDGAAAMCREILREEPGMALVRNNLKLFCDIQDKRGAIRPAIRQDGARQNGGRGLSAEPGSVSVPSIDAGTQETETERCIRTTFAEPWIGEKFERAGRREIADTGSRYTVKSAEDELVSRAALKPEERQALAALRKRSGAAGEGPGFDLGKRYGEGYRITYETLRCDVKPLLEEDRDAPSCRGRGGIVVFPGAYDKTDVLYLCYGDSFETMYLLKEGGGAPAERAFRYEVAGAAAAVDPSGALVISDGKTRLELTRPVIVDSRGKTAAGYYTVDAREEDGPSVVTLAFNDRDLTYPLLVDPTWRTTANVMGAARSRATVTLLPNGKVLVAGGINGSCLSTAELFDPHKGAFAPTGSMSIARSDHVAVLLPSGKVLVAGGLNESGPHSTAELYDPAAGSFTATDTMATPRGLPAAVLLSDGRVLVAGGVDGVGTSLSTAELYDPDSETFTATGSMGTGRAMHAMTPLSDGRVLVCGGFNGGSCLSSAEIYSNGSFSPTGLMTAVRATHSAILLPNGNVLVTGGYNAGSPCSTAELYSPAAGTFATTGAMTVPRCLHTSTLLPDGRILLAGGQTTGGASLASTEIYNPATATCAGGGSMSAARSEHSSVLLPGGKVAIVGGRNYADWDNGTYLSSVDYYDPTIAAFAGAGNMRAKRFSHTSTVLADGKVLLAGGGSGLTSVNSSAEVFDPSNGSFTSVGSMKTTRVDHTATLLPNGKVLIAGGSYKSTTELFDPSNNSFAYSGSMSVGRSQHSATLLPNGKVLIAGGLSDSSTGLSTAEIYDPDTGAFSPAADNLSVSRGYHTATLLPNNKILLAGGCQDGSNYLLSSELYDIATGLFSPGPNMTAYRREHVAVLLQSGKVLLTAGRSSGTSGIKDTDLYDPASNTFTTGPQLGTGRFLAAAVLLPSGKVLVAGGCASTTYYSSTELYDPELGIFYAGPNLTAKRSCLVTTLLPDGRVLITGGMGGLLSFNSSADLARYTEYDYTALKPAITSVGGSSSFPVEVVKNTVYTIGGSGFTGTPDGGGSNAPAHYPRVILKGLDSGSNSAKVERQYYVDYSTSLYPMSAAQWSSADTSLSFKMPEKLPQGTYMLSVMANGAPSAAKIIRYINHAPSAPSSLAQRSSDNNRVISWGGVTGNRSPLLQFVLSDPDGVDLLRYVVQVSANSDYSSPVISYTSPLRSPGSASYSCSALPEGKYYWRVMCTDEYEGNSSYASGTVVDEGHFGVDTSSPSVPALSMPLDGATVNQLVVDFDWADATDQWSGIAGYVLKVSSAADFTGTVYSSSTANSHAALSLAQGNWYWTVCSTDTVGNSSAWATAWNLSIDTTPCSAVANLSAETGYGAGEIRLHWNATGDDGTIGTITGGAYRVRYSTYIAAGGDSFWTGGSWTDLANKYEIMWSTDTAAGAAQQRVLTGLTEGVTYYARLWIRDEAAGTGEWDGNWSPLSNGATAWAQVAIFNVVVEPRPRLDFGSVAARTSKVLTSSFSVTNQGNIRVQYQLQLTGVPASWTVKETAGSPGSEQIKVRALFAASQPASGDFADGPATIEGGDIVKASAPDTATSGSFAVQGDAIGVKGYNCEPGEVRYLWFMFDAPSDTVVITPQYITVTVTAVRD